MSFIFFAFIFIVAMAVGYTLGKDQGLKEGKKLAAKENQRTAEVAILLEYFRKDALTKYGGGNSRKDLDEIVKEAQQKLAKLIEIPEKKDEKK
ncbi:MAG: hypothetical protein ACRCR4_05540 [Thiotrichaceae bacterium]|jgi:hypothetical protein|uniref:Uncharacterized protein n=1 Tax=Candidatus Thiocaldithrix dubininis TaxID=3080823 RepID=A0AA95H5V6_9GAMM|nr:MAG: hypothetical protein QJT80_15385 [Candidatus Thiocaldithrix dubininis]